VPVPKRASGPARYRRHDGLSPTEAAKQYAVKQATPPKRDDTAAIELAIEFGADVDDVLELYTERAGIRQWDGGESIDNAEVGAIGDVRAILQLRFAKRTG
jgi:hypothetical protein